MKRSKSGNRMQHHVELDDLSTMRRLRSAGYRRIKRNTGSHAIHDKVFLDVDVPSCAMAAILTEGDAVRDRLFGQD